MAKEIYLDNNATTKPLPEVREAMLKVLGDDFGNPSSAHSSGRRTLQLITKSRESVSKLIGTSSENLFFTSSGTESNNLVFFSYSRNKQNPLKIVTTTVEHSSILKACEYLESQGIKVVYLPVNSKGSISLSQLENELDSRKTLVSIQWINNETGVIQPIEKIVPLCQQKKALFHTDASQAVGKINISLGKLPIDYLTLTGHKFNGPQGIGALYAKETSSLSPFFYGGSQEKSLRPGTENVPGIVGAGVAAEIRQKTFEECQHKMQTLRNAFEQKILERIPQVTVNGETQQRVCNTTNLLFKGLEGQALLAQLDMSDIRCSQSSACTNKRPEPSYVLRAMGLSEEDAFSSIRFSFSPENSLQEVEFAVDKIEEICKRLRRFASV